MKSGRMRMLALAGFAGYKPTWRVKLMTWAIRWHILCIIWEVILLCMGNMPQKIAAVAGMCFSLGMIRFITWWINYTENVS